MKGEGSGVEGGRDKREGRVGIGVGMKGGRGGEAGRNERGSGKIEGGSDKREGREWSEWAGGWEEKEDGLVDLYLTLSTIF